MFSAYRSYSFCHCGSEKKPEKYVKEWMWIYSYKTLFIKQVAGLYLRTMEHNLFIYMPPAILDARDASVNKTD